MVLSLPAQRTNAQPKGFMACGRRGTGIGTGHPLPTGSRARGDVFNLPVLLFLACASCMELKSYRITGRRLRAQNTENKAIYQTFKIPTVCYNSYPSRPAT